MNEADYLHIEYGITLAGTPCYVFFEKKIATALSSLTRLKSTLPVRHLLSLKTAPLKKVAEYWLSLGLGIEVVSEYELKAALECGFDPGSIVVNGPIKHTWISSVDIHGLTIYFDSVRETELLAVTAKRKSWKPGLRIHMSNQRDPDSPQYQDQFGINPLEIHDAVAILSAHGLDVEAVHFHLGSNVGSPDKYIESLYELAGICWHADIRPLFVDCGGGLPVCGEHVLQGDTEWTSNNLYALERVFDKISQLFSSVTEVWLENGRYLFSRSAVLALTVHDIKHLNGQTYLICDGGRTNHALPSDWERHDVRLLRREVTTNTTDTVICGPTCMAFDWIYRGTFPDDVVPGDIVLWMNAGAYHIPWETRFSRGYCPVVWFDNDDAAHIVRKREAFQEWWDMWI